MFGVLITAIMMTKRTSFMLILLKTESLIQHTKAPLFGKLFMKKIAIFLKAMNVQMKLYCTS